MHRRGCPISRTSRTRSPHATRGAIRVFRSSATTRSGTSRTWRSSSLPRTKAGKPCSPLVYARMARAAYAGIKAGNTQSAGRRSARPRRAVANGRSARRRRRTRSRRASSPSSSRRLLPQLKFDAWAHHPYSGLGQGPTAKVAFPNVNLTAVADLREEARSVVQAESSIPIWVTEYGFETKPGEPKGVTIATAGVVRQAGARVRPATTRTSTCSSGSSSATTRRARGRAASRTRTTRGSRRSRPSPRGRRALDFRSPHRLHEGGASNPVLVPVWELRRPRRCRSQLGATVSVTYQWPFEHRRLAADVDDRGSTATRPS